MTPEEIPDELLNILNAHSGTVHSRDGRVVRTLAMILTRHEEMIRNGSIAPTVGDSSDRGKRAHGSGVRAVDGITLHINESIPGNPGWFYR